MIAPSCLPTSNCPSQRARIDDEVQEMLGDFERNVRDGYTTFVIPTVRSRPDGRWWMVSGTGGTASQALRESVQLAMRNIRQQGYMAEHSWQCDANRACHLYIGVSKLVEGC